MKKPRNVPRYICGLILALAGLVGGVTLLPGRVSAQMIAPSWTSTGDLNTPRYAHTATLLPNGKVLVAGGAGPNSCSSPPTSTAELYDPVSGTWSATGSLNTARLNHTATLLQNSQVLVAGGYGPTVSLNSAELYDPATAIWRPTGRFNTIRAHGSVTLLPNGKVLAVGDSSAKIISAELYDPSTGMWSSTGAPSFVPWSGHTVLLPNGKVLAVFEGSPWDGDGVGTELYDPATGQWSTSGYLNMFWAPTVTLLRNGKVLVTGLYGANHPTQAELYDTDKGTWGLTGNLSTFRHYGGYTATLLANGQVLVAGGIDYITNQPVRAEELYDPATGTWTLTSRLTRGRGSHTATLLRNGKVLVAGGVDGLLCDSSIHRSVELYDSGITSSTNPIDDPHFFVRQQYLDFLGREPDQVGWDYWTNEISKCGTDAGCIHSRRIGVSAAFFVEAEFQETGYVVYRLYRAAHGARISCGTEEVQCQTCNGGKGSPCEPRFLPNVAHSQFVTDRAQLVGGPGLPQSTSNFANNFVQRPEFKQTYPEAMTQSDFVNRLFDTANLTGSANAAQRQTAIDALTNGRRTRAQVLLDLIEISEFKTREYNAAFVLMQYFGYLLRDPDEGGYYFWLDVVNNRVRDNYRAMVCAFLTSTEYQLRFGSVVTRTDADCGQSGKGAWDY